VVTFFIANELGPREFSTTRTDFLFGLAFLTPFVPGVRFIDQAYWSLVVELQFYFFVGVIYAAARGRFVRAWTVFVGAGLVCWIAGSKGELHGLRALAERALLVPYLPQFTLGIAFYYLYNGRTAGWRLLVVLAALNYVIVARAAPAAWHLAHAIMVLLFVLFVWGRLAWLAVRPLTILGEISYSLYLIHAYVGITLIGLVTRRTGAPDLIAVLFATLVCVGLAFALTKGVEIPAKRALLDWGRAHASVARRFPSLAFTTVLPVEANTLKSREFS